MCKLSLERWQAEKREQLSCLQTAWTQEPKKSNKWIQELVLLFHPSVMGTNVWKLSLLSKITQTTASRSTWVYFLLVCLNNQTKWDTWKWHNEDHSQDLQAHFSPYLMTHPLPTKFYVWGKKDSTETKSSKTHSCRILHLSCIYERTNISWKKQIINRPYCNACL